MKLRTRDADYVFITNGAKMEVLYDGKKESVETLKIWNGIVSMKLRTADGDEKEINTAPIKQLIVALDFETRSGAVYKIRSCQNHLMLFCDGEFEGEIECVSGLDGKSTLEMSLKKLDKTSFKFHI